MADAGDDEKSTLLGRMWRYAGVGGGVAGVAARGAARWLGGKGPLDPGNARDMARMLSALRGPLMKGAQVAGSLPDVFPPEFAAELARLQSDAPGMGPAFVRRRMTAELGADWQTKFKSFDLKAAHAASLGQVHRAVAHDGRMLACKLQYPGMQSAVEADLTQLKTVLALQRAAASNFDTTEIATELGERLREELDYVREAKHMRLFRAMMEGHPDVTVPLSIAELSTPRLLTMTWLEGASFRDALKAPEGRREDIARALFAAWWVPLYRFGVVHGDAHLGNYTVRDDGGINLLDFGCVRILPPGVVGALVDLYHALQAGDDALAAKAYAGWGFADVTSDLVEKMNVWSRLVFGPLLDDRARTIAGESSLFAEGPQQIWALKQRLREGGAIRPPREFVFVARALVGIGAAFVHLDAKLNWHRMFEELIEGFDAAAVARRQREALALAGIA
jgi:predicted unusual protein kinase regulating ubiquinone biosynthesis (AarF/ABC1/UbiB family)